MGYQILQIKDDLGNTVDLGVLTPESTVAIRAFDESVHGTLSNKFGASLGSGTVFSTSGNHDVVTPTPGKSIRLRWIALATSADNGGEVVVTVKIGTSVLYQWPLGAPGAFAHGSVREGGADEKLIVNLSASYPVFVNYEYEEF